AAAGAGVPAGVLPAADGPRGLLRLFQPAAGGRRLQSRDDRVVLGPERIGGDRPVRGDATPAHPLEPAPDPRRQPGADGPALGADRPWQRLAAGAALRPVPPRPEFWRLPRGVGGVPAALFSPRTARPGPGPLLGGELWRRGCPGGAVWRADVGNLAEWHLRCGRVGDPVGGPGGLSLPANAPG